MSSGDGREFSLREERTWPVGREGARSQDSILEDEMSTFLPVDEQMDLLQKGAAEIIRVSDLRERLEESRKTGKPLRVKAGFDLTAPDRPGTHGADAQAAAFSAARAYGDLSGRRFHFSDRRSDGTQRHTQASHARNRLMLMPRLTSSRFSRFSTRR